MKTDTLPLRQTAEQTCWFVIYGNSKFCISVARG